MGSAASTDRVAPDQAPRAFDPDVPARLHPQVALRPEPFGALAYHYDTRRLVFVKSDELVAVLRDLEHHDSPRAAARAHVTDQEVDAIVAAIGRLSESGVVDGR